MNCDFGLIGLAVMGENLALNVESRGYQRGRVQSHDQRRRQFHQRPRRRQEIRRLPFAGRTGQKPEPAAQSDDDGQSRPGGRFARSSSCCRCWKRAMSSSTAATRFIPTPNAARSMSNRKACCIVGCGVSGGEEGALKGPSMMPGGSEAAWPIVKPIFQAIAAKVGPKNDIPCCDWVGPRGAGHYVKMVHNGIEYGDMQLICEAYNMLKNGLGLTNDELYDVFAEWNKGELDSYLIEITRDIFSVKDPETGNIHGRFDSRHRRRERHRQMDEPVGARSGRAQHVGHRSRLCPWLSALKEERVRASKVLHGPAVKYEGDAKAVHRSRAAGAVRFEDLQLCPRLCAVASGGEGTQMAARLRQHRHAVARRLHYSGAFSGSHQRSVRCRQEFGKSAARAVFPRGAIERPRPRGVTPSRPPSTWAFGRRRS